MSGNTARPLYVRQGQNLLADSVHPLLVATRGNLILATYLQAQFATFNFQFACGLQLLFPRYRLSADPSFLWRLTLTENAGQHLDVFAGGRPWPADQFRRQRLKAFINIDFAPRHWRVTHDVPGVLAAGHGLLPRTLPADPNVLNDVINRSGILGRLPFQTIPPDIYGLLAASRFNGVPVGARHIQPAAIASSCWRKPWPHSRIWLLWWRFR